MLFNSNWLGEYIFAFDNIKDKKLIEVKLKLIRKYTNKVLKFYIFCGFNHKNNDYSIEFWKQDIIDTFERIKILMKYNCIPYIMRYYKYTESPYRGIYINLARWCNQPSFFKKKSLREFCFADVEYTKNKKCASLRYLQEFELYNKDVANKYFDIKFGQI